MNAPEPNILDQIEIKKPKKPKPRAPRPDTVTTDPPGAERHFRPLGYDNDRLYFLCRGSQQIHDIPKSRIGKKSELFLLAPLDWWEREFVTDAGFSGRAVDMATNYLIRACEKAGSFSPERRRGRGVWIDGDNIVIHAGDRLYINGEEVALLDAQTEGVYERQPALIIPMHDPLPTTEARKVLEFGRSLNWECGTYAYLWAGWVVAGLISGALCWRPHILINGPKGCGKTSTIHTQVRLHGGFCLSVTGGTSAAGLRQSLASDALPVVFDEAEGDSHRSAANIDDVLALMRHSSAGFDAKVIKGGADGRANATTIQSCFCLAAIRDQIHQAADQSRITVLSLRAATAESRATLKTITIPLANAITNPEYVRRLHGRIFSRIPEILESVRVCTEAATSFFQDSRMGDQIGALIGAGWMLDNDRPPTEREAIQRLDLLTWRDQNDLLEDASDEIACLRAILEAHLRVDGEQWHGDMAIGELVDLVRDQTANAPIPKTDATATLARYGLRVEDGRLLISNTNGMLARKVMSQTSWPKGWSKLLARLPGAIKPDRVIKIGGHVSRCVSVPLDVV